MMVSSTSLSGTVARKPWLEGVRYRVVEDADATTDAASEAARSTSIGNASTTIDRMNTTAVPAGFGLICVIDAGSTSRQARKTNDDYRHSQVPYGSTSLLTTTSNYPTNYSIHTLYHNNQSHTLALNVAMNAGRDDWAIILIRDIWDSEDYRSNQILHPTQFPLAFRHPIVPVRLYRDKLGFTFDNFETKYYLCQVLNDGAYSKARFLVDSNDYSRLPKFFSCSDFFVSSQS
ncbi:hypothetical protein M422DRAFT_55943 [Sphaerobolus stellatus SS14]|uniref:Unplaced genomic scaffold SPHSTscaffold_336, whole genome shotgun sequence n=1 Tax=Sphaerobolus stellatus (strain SS14) TaxID=990650 RepID=A0A0C9U901_SPHS4|nr:hypothetical protein M422DRAFT_55943 [Sphaerobolus stellatus SS14]